MQSSSKKTRKRLFRVYSLYIYIIRFSINSLEKDVHSTLASRFLFFLFLFFFVFCFLQVTFFHLKIEELPRNLMNKPSVNVQIIFVWQLFCYSHSLVFFFSTESIFSNSVIIKDESTEKSVHFFFDILLLWRHILPYPKDGLVQHKHILRA